MTRDIRPDTMPDPEPASADNAQAYLPGGEQYPTPILPPAEVAELEQLTAEQVITVRDAQALNIANLGTDNIPHFLATIDGVEQCGGCAKPWPCPVWTSEIHPQAVVASDDQASADPLYTAEEISAAELLGLTAAEVRELVKRR